MMVGEVIAIVVIAAFVFWLLRHDWSPPRRALGWDFPIFTSRYMPPGQIFIMSPEVFDRLAAEYPVRLKEQVTHDELWHRLSMPMPILVDPKAVIKITGV